MAWFKVDDTLHGHPKVRRAGAAAAGAVVRRIVPNMGKMGAPGNRTASAGNRGLTTTTLGSRDG